MAFGSVQIQIPKLLNKMIYFILSMSDAQESAEREQKSAARELKERELQNSSSNQKYKQ